MNKAQPLVSVFSFCKDRASSIRRSIESVLNQSYRNLEFIIQDGASTDGTVEIIKSYNDPRIKLVSEPDSGPAEGFWKALNRCEGEIIASCLSDEELLPRAIEEAVAIFAAHPAVGAVTRDGYVTDAGGKVTADFIAGEFDLVDYLFGRYCPMWVASFFRRQALLDVGLKSTPWTIGCLEFEIWCRLGTQHNVRYFPGIVAKYAVDAKQLSNTPRHIDEHLDNRTKVIEDLFSANGFFGDDETKRLGCLYNQHYLFYNHARAYRLFEQVDRIYDRMRPLLDKRGLAMKAEYDSLFGEAESEIRHRQGVHNTISQWWLLLSARVPQSLKRRLPPARRTAIRRRVEGLAYLLISALPALQRRSATVQAQGSARTSKRDLQAQVYSKEIHHHVAGIFYGRGQIDHAQFHWRKAQELGSAAIDSVAVQALLLSPTVTNEGLLEAQRLWASRHAKPLPDLAPMLVPAYDGKREIRVGYYCSFFDGDVFRAMFAPVVRSHDRRRVVPIAYSLTAAAHDIESAFSEFKVTGLMPDREFVELVRADKIDVFVEMSGFSTQHRFSAMASRCAPVQVSYFNHTGTSAVPNVDYVFADHVSVPVDQDRFFTEKVWRLEGDHLFFSYEWANLPAPGDPPCTRNGYVTFGCFGSGGKVHDGLIALWARLLHRVPGARIYIRHSYLGSPANREFMHARFARHGIGSERVRLGAAEPWREFIKSYDDVDISLDTWPYCGANTVGESVWQGVPVVTLKGDRFSSRYGASHAIAAGCPELVAESPERYVQIAAELAAAPQRIRDYRRNLRQMAKHHGLSDPERFARKLEKTYAAMLSALHAGPR